MIIRRSLCVWVLGLVSAAAACSSNGGSESPAPANEDGVGSLGLALQTSGVTLTSFDYVVTGPAGFARQGTVDIAKSNVLTGLIGGIPVGKGYSVAISATDGTVACTGSASFEVAARATSKVQVHLQCRSPSKTGSVLINGDLNHCPLVESIGASPQSVLVGSSLSLTALAKDTDSAPSALSYAWSASSGTFTGATAKETSFTCTKEGEVTITVKVSDGDCEDTLSVLASCTSASGGGGGVPRVVVNEVESNGGVPGDWVELYNAGDGTADLSGWMFKDNDDSHAFYVVPSGTTLAPGAYLVLEEAQFGFGLGGTDSARVWDAFGNPVDSFNWTSHATSSYGRCANGSGAFVQTASTKAAANSCGGSGGGGGGASGAGGASGSGGASGLAGAAGSGGVGGADGGSVLAWPGTPDVSTVDEAGFFGTNMSGLSYQAATASGPAVLWAVQNSPSKLYRLVNNGGGWVAEAGAWSAGKLVHYVSGVGAPDCEGIVQPDPNDFAMYVATERDNNDNQVSRLTILRVDTSSPAAELTATNEWNLTADLPVVGPNLGLEGIAFVPDSALVAGGFVDQSTQALYNPALYPNHAGGLFFVGVEGNGHVYGYALDHVSGSFTRVATFGSGQPGIMDLAYDRENNYLWAYCDNTCGNKSTLLRLNTGGFQISRVYGPPAALPASNNEGITFAPGTECVAGQRSFFWSDDDQAGGHALRRGSIPCGSLF